MPKLYSNDWHNWIPDISIFFHVPCLFVFNNFVYLFLASSLVLHWFFIAAQTFLSSCRNWGLFFTCDMWASHCSGPSCCGAQALVLLGSIVAAYDLCSTGSIVVAHRRSCSTAWGIFPDQGLNPCLLHWQPDSSTLSHQGSPHIPYS